MEIVLASGNPGKLRELEVLFEALPLRLRPQSDFDVPEAAETGLSFVENALIKARNAARHGGRPALADDSGIAVAALDGAPGIYSARYAGEAATDSDNLNKLLADTAHLGEEQRQCYFICIMAFLRHARDPIPIITQGIWAGHLLRAPRGEHGFGYDPIFFVPEHGMSSAELAPATKNEISHRALASRAMAEALGRDLGARAT